MIEPSLIESISVTPSLGGGVREPPFLSA